MQQLALSFAAMLAGIKLATSSRMVLNAMSANAVPTSKLAMVATPAKKYLNQMI